MNADISEGYRPVGKRAFGLKLLALLTVSAIVIGGGAWFFGASPPSLDSHVRNALWLGVSLIWMVRIRGWIIAPAPADDDRYDPSIHRVRLENIALLIGFTAIATLSVLGLMGWLP